MRGLPPDTSENFAHWLQRHGQTQRAIDRFWKPVLVSALNEDLERISVHYAAKVFRESFLLSPQAGRMGIPSIPLSELYGAAVGYLRERGSEVYLRTSVESVTPIKQRLANHSAGRSPSPPTPWSSRSRSKPWPSCYPSSRKCRKKAGSRQPSRSV